MRIAVFGIVMHVGRADVALQDLERLSDIAHNVCVSKIETHAHVVEARSMNEFHELVGRGKFVGNIFEEEPNAKRLGKGSQMLNGSHRRLDLPLIERLAAGTQVLYQESKGNLLGDLKSTLDFIHRLNTACSVSGRDIDRGSPRASPLVIRVHGRMHRIERHATGPEPICDLAHMLLAVGIVEMRPRREDFNRLCTAAHQAVQQARM